MDLTKQLQSATDQWLIDIEIIAIRNTALRFGKTKAHNERVESLIKKILNQLP